MAQIISRLQLEVRRMMKYPERYDDEQIERAFRAIRSRRVSFKPEQPEPPEAA